MNKCNYSVYIIRNSNCFKLNSQNFLKKILRVIDDCHKLKGVGDLVTLTIYDRLTLAWKAGKERPPETRVYRLTSTCKKAMSIWGEVNHLNHWSDEQKFKFPKVFVWKKMTSA